MSSWVEQAADRAVELAGELAQRNVSMSEAELIERRIRVAAHLTYMAGLLRGGEPRDMENDLLACVDELKQDRHRMRVERDGLAEMSRLLAEDWRRIEKLVGREFTSPESTIDRVAWLVERENERTALAAELKESRKEYAATALQLAKLLQAARRVIDGDLGRYEEVTELHQVVMQIETDLSL